MKTKKLAACILSVILVMQPYGIKKAFADGIDTTVENGEQEYETILDETEKIIEEETQDTEPSNSLENEGALENILPGGNIFFQPAFTPFALTETAHDLASLQTALGNVNDGGVIIITADIDITARLSVTGNKSITIMGEKGKEKLNRSVNDDYLIEIDTGSALTLANIILDGKKETYAANTSSLVYVKGQFTLEKGAVLKNNKNNDAIGKGGAVTVDSNASFVMKAGEISGNEATYGGGVYVESNAFFIMETGEISGNNGSYGGGVYIEQNGEFTMKNGKINNNTTTTGGGGIYLSSDNTSTGSSFIMENGEIKDNISGMNGGGVYASSYCSFTMKTGTISGNSTNIHGGGVFSTVDTSFLMENGIISGNSARVGAGACIYYTGSFTMKAGEFSGNIASEEGGGLYVDRSVAAVIERGTIRGNTAPEGGGIYLGEIGPVNSNGFTMESGEISGNTATGKGGGVYITNSSSFTIKNVKISSNTATDGGGIYVASTGKFTMQDGEISGNTAIDGGGIYAAPANITIAKGNFSANLANEGRYIAAGDLAAYAPLNPTKVSSPFTHIANNFDLYYTGSGSPVYVAAFMKNDGTTAEIARVSVNAAPSPLGADFPQKPTWAGYTFTAWNTLADGSGTTINENSLLGGASQRIYAQWQKWSPSSDSGGSDSTSELSYTVSFETNGGGSIKERIVPFGKNLEQPSSPAREGYIFTGWYTDTKLTTHYNFDQAVTKNFTLYAGWELEEEEVEIIIHYFPAYVSGYPDGSFRPDSPITRAEAATMVYNLSKQLGRYTETQTVTHPYSDVSENMWFSAAVDILSLQGVFSGYNDGIFAPEQNITRAEFTTMALRFSGVAPENGSSIFKDVDKRHWAFGYILAATNEGILSGYPDGTFKPDDSITRAEAVTILNEITGRDDELIIPEPNAFADVPSRHWAYNAILKAASDCEKEEIVPLS